MPMRMSNVFAALDSCNTQSSLHSPLMLQFCTIDMLYDCAWQLASQPANALLVMNCNSTSDLQAPGSAQSTDSA
jgi:hypothetical protein